MNSGFGSSTPRTENRKAVREGREKGFLPRLLGVGRTGKAPAKVPYAMLRAMGVKYPEEETADIDEILAGYGIGRWIEDKQYVTKVQAQRAEREENAKAIKYVYLEVFNAATGREVVFCHECKAEWWKEESGLNCPACGGRVTEIVEQDFDVRPPPISTYPHPWRTKATVQWSIMSQHRHNDSTNSAPK